MVTGAMKVRGADCAPMPGGPWAQYIDRRYTYMELYCLIHFSLFGAFTLVLWCSNARQLVWGFAYDLGDRFYATFEPKIHPKASTVGLAVQPPSLIFLHTR